MFMIINIIIELLYHSHYEWFDVTDQNLRVIQQHKDIKTCPKLL